MSASNLQRLMWLMSYMARHPEGVTKKELDVAWLNSGMGKDDARNFPRQTLNNLIMGVGIAFGVDIVYDKKIRRYRIEEIDVLDNNPYKKWLVDSFSVLGLVKDNKAIQKYIQFESISGGGNNLEKILQAIMERRTITMVYGSVNEDEYQCYEIMPYCLKLYNRRWYVLAKLTQECYNNLKQIGDQLAREHNRPYLNLMLGDNSRLWVFALDELDDVKQTTHSYEIPADFKSEGFTDDVVGTSLYHTHIQDDGRVDATANGLFGEKEEEIFIKARYAVADAVMHKPIHRSQELYAQSESKDFLNAFKVFKYTLHPTTDFYSDLLYYGPAIEVLAPESARLKMKETIERMLDNYKKRSSEV